MINFNQSPWGKSYPIATVQVTNKDKENPCGCVYVYETRMEFFPANIYGGKADGMKVLVLANRDWCCATPEEKRECAVVLCGRFSDHTIVVEGPHGEIAAYERETFSRPTYH